MASPAETRLRKRNHADSLGVVAVEPEVEGEMVGPHMPMYAKRNLLLDDESLPHFRKRSATSLRDELFNIVLLVFLYMLQGVPLGLTASIPLVLQNRHVTYKQQAMFSFAHWPFSLKLLWAPIVDSVFSVRFGRRKSWLIPTQYLIGFFMLLLSKKVDSFLGDENAESSNPDLFKLTVIFFSFNFLAATQDIVVDGWALTMLSPENVGYASTCNVVGQTAGYFLGNVVFLALESKEFSNRYLRSEPLDRGIITLSEYLFYWAVIFLVSTTLVLLFKAEKDDRAFANMRDVGKTYCQLLHIIRLKPVVALVSVYLTAKIAFAAADGITAVPIVPIEVLLPLFIGKYTAGPRPLDVYLKAYPYRNMLSLAFAFAIWWTPSWKTPDGRFPPMYYVFILVIFAVQQVSSYCIFVSQMAFHAQVSDPTVGGTYMTLLNTVANLGGNWPVTVALMSVDSMAYKVCTSENPRRCQVLVEGYYVLIMLGVVIGWIWLFTAGKVMRRLQTVDRSSWWSFSQSA
uniref:Acetyl-coenzyme A transporter 1 n=1 Tax=Trichuris muris TaxID=70415 RepID=A0A5S6QD88_TRIMR